MPEPYRSLKIFLSSPGDVLKERKIAESVIEAVNARCRDVLGVRVDFYTYEQLRPIIPNTSDETIQNMINEQIKQCSAFVLLLGKRYGAIEPGQKKSNTEREIEIALKMQSEGRSMAFFSYFKNLMDNIDKGPQERKVRQLRAELKKHGLIYDFDDEHGFRDRFTHDLYETILRFDISIPKQRALNTFWQLGTPEGAIHTELAIIYQPVDRVFMPEEKPDKYWLRRLVPYIVFEDYKALTKIERTLRIIGFRDYRIYNSGNLPLDLHKMNRVWICLPRNELGQRQLKQYQERAKFTFVKNHRKSIIQWQPNRKGSTPLIIHSPLSKYLEEQRKERPGGVWSAEHGRMLAKDFAIIARFSDMNGRKKMPSDPLKDFFLAGIRGLGTWGAGWFLDRCYNDFEGKCERPNSDVQFLLEVTYKNERILSVHDVSQKSQSYFDAENNLQTIRKRIRENT